MLTKFAGFKQAGATYWRRRSDLNSRNLGELPGTQFQNRHLGIGDYPAWGRGWRGDVYCKGTTMSTNYCMAAFSFLRTVKNQGPPGHAQRIYSRCPQGNPYFYASATTMLGAALLHAIRSYHHVNKPFLRRFTKLDTSQNATSTGDLSVSNTDEMSQKPIHQVPETTGLPTI